MPKHPDDKKNPVHPVPDVKERLFSLTEEEEPPELPQASAAEVQAAHQRSQADYARRAKAKAPETAQNPSPPKFKPSLDVIPEETGPATDTAAPKAWSRVQGFSPVSETEEDPKKPSPKTSPQKHAP